MIMDKHFICTSDIKTCKTLRELGFQEITFDGRRWVFLNDYKMNFSSEIKNVEYTDILHF